LVESEAINEYVRDAALDAFVALAHTGQMTREAVVAYFTSLFQAGSSAIIHTRGTASWSRSRPACA